MASVGQCVDIRLTAYSFDIGQAEVDTEWDRESQPERRSRSRGRGADVWRLTAVCADGVAAAVELDECGSSGLSSTACGFPVRRCGSVMVAWHAGFGRCRVG